LELLFLGTGTSHGVPMIGCDCEVCASTDPRDRRTRASVVISWDDHHVAVDTPPDFRQQLLANDVTRMDALLYTHHHADHIHGIDDVRVFSSRSGVPMPTFGDAELCRFFRRTFRYIFAVNPDNLNVPRMNLQAVDGPFNLFGRRIQPVPVRHGANMALGYRIDGLAYVPDCSGIPESSRPLLQGLEVLVLDALKPTPHPTHFSLPESLAAIEDLAPRRAYLTGLSHRISHARTAADLPDGVALAFDGLRVRIA